MKRFKAFSAVMLTLQLVGMLTLAFNIQLVNASVTIYIKADGSVDPDTAPISTVDNFTYTLTDDIYDSIVVERDNITVDGASYTVQGMGSGTGIDLSGRSNVTIKNIRIEAFQCGIRLDSSLDNTIFRNFITAGNEDGILLHWSSRNNISENTVTNNTFGISFGWSSNYNRISDNNLAVNERFGIGLGFSSNYNIISGNNITENGSGLEIYDNSSNNTICGNNITSNLNGVLLDWSTNNRLTNNNVAKNLDGIYIGYLSNYNTISGNNITYNLDGIFLSWCNNNTFTNNYIATNEWTGIYLEWSSENRFYHNNLVSNGMQAHSEDSSNIWDDGYPFGGNYWSDYDGVDFYHGPIQNETGSDGVGDTPYVIYEENVDRYPLMIPFVPLMGDINGDRSVNAADAIQLGLSFGLREDDPDWNPDADLYNDGYVNAKDVVILGSHFSL